MKRASLILSMTLSLALAAGAIPISEVQFSSAPGAGGTWPSDREGQTVQIEGVVTATGYIGSRFFLQDAAAAWSGVLIWDQDIQPAVGDRLTITGTVLEYGGHTEISPVSDWELVASNQPLPEPVLLSSGQVDGEEAWEGVLVRLENPSVTQAPDNYGQWWVDDGSGACEVDDVFFPLADGDFDPQPGAVLAGLTGIADFQYGSHAINPRSPQDFQLFGGLWISARDTQLALEETAVCWLDCGALAPVDGVDGYSVEFALPPELVALSEVVTEGTLSAGREIALASQGAGQFTLQLPAGAPLVGEGPLVGLALEGLAVGSGTLAIQTATLGETELAQLDDGRLTVAAPPEAIGDTLTLIMRPLLNIPEIVEQDAVFTAWADAPPTAGDWSAALLREGLRQELAVESAAFDAAEQWWRLELRAPAAGWTGLSDLELACDAAPTDVSRHAVQLLEQRPESFWIAHVTDTHLPTHMFYTEPGALEDSSSMADLRAVFADLAVIQPAFVLLTGDLVNEGELEEFLQARYWTRAQRLLAECPAPVYLVAGNHDLGGWDATPPPAGTSRQDWWRFFGWPRLADPPPGAPARTQDFFFDYGPLRVVGLESWINYEGWLPAVYGGESFRTQQLDWLQQTLAQAGPEQRRVLIYHEDFSDQLDLPALDVELALHGHIHSDNGSLNGPPWSLATDQCTDGGCSFRLIRVTPAGLQPQATQHACDGDPLRVFWNGPNDGSRDSLTATVVNDYPLAFPEARVEARLSPEVGDVAIAGGELRQLIRTPLCTLVEIGIDLDAEASLVVTVSGIAPSLEAPLLEATYAGGVLTLGWAAVPGATDYRVESSQGPGLPWTDASAQGVFVAGGWRQAVPGGQRLYRVIALR